MIGDAEQLNNVAFLEGGCKTVHLPAELLPTKPRLPGRTGADAMQRLADQRKHAPHGKCL
jgi:hypothetical protein